jgi:hypothetical protein
MRLTIDRTRPASYYVSKYHVPILSECATYFVDALCRSGAARHFDLDNPPLFTHIEIETYNRCNNDCDFCPANVNFDKREPKFMEAKLFSRIVENLRELHFSGHICLYHNNEPLLDSRLPEFVRECVGKLPSATVEVSTNGLLLNRERLDDLRRAGLKKLVINNYDYQRGIQPHTKQLIATLEEHDANDNMEIVVWIRDKGAVLTNRAGHAPNRAASSRTDIERQIIQRKWCKFPFTQFNVGAHGVAHLCCYDVLYEKPIGDLRARSILEIWRGEEIRRIREELLTHGRRNLYPCANCDKL